MESLWINYGISHVEWLLKVLVDVMVDIIYNNKEHKTYV